MGHRLVDEENSRSVNAPEQVNRGASRVLRMTPTMMWLRVVLQYPNDNDDDDDDSVGVDKGDETCSTLPT